MKTFAGSPSHILATALMGAALTTSLPGPAAAGEHSVARQWNEALLHAIRHDFARPTVHARNLCHVSLAMYDAWAVYDDVAGTFLIGRTLDGYTAPFEGVTPPEDPAELKAAREEAISYAAYKVLKYRFEHSPDSTQTLGVFDDLMATLGYDTAIETTDYTSGSPAELGNYIAEQVLFFGGMDQSNEQGGYGNLYYEPVNEPLILRLPGNPDIENLNRWQPLEFETFIDQSGNPIPGTGVVPPFLSPEWGAVSPFSLSVRDRTVYSRDGASWIVYHDPGPPPYIDVDTGGGTSDEYQWGFGLVAVWSSHLDPDDGVMWDISPGGIGNIGPLPRTLEEYHDFYDLLEGGDTSAGWDVNPVTGQPYEPQLVPRGDYARVLAEFWADGPDSETPPGHWFTILNYVNDHPLFEKRFEGEGPVLDDLEWDVKAYITLGGTMHDVAVASWGVKGYYDYIRPISAIRAMAALGQSSDPALPSYHPGGMQLVPGKVELVAAGDTLAGDDDQNVGKIKLLAWRGHDFIDDPEVDEAGVGWILAETWWPYQRPTFVTPPFAGYVSGHSTFSRAAAVVMTLLTGTPYFPGGLGEFHAPMNEFLVFEEGPSQDVVLQWATYTDASDQTSLSRIWGGIHPPADDIPGRFMGEEIGADAFAHARNRFLGVEPSTTPPSPSTLYPNPVGASGAFVVEFNVPTASVRIRMSDVQGRLVRNERRAVNGNPALSIEILDLAPGVYFLELTARNWRSAHRVVVVR